MLSKDIAIVMVKYKAYSNNIPSQVIKTTRGLSMKKRKQKIEKAENSISWTSFKLNQQ